MGACLRDAPVATPTSAPARFALAILARGLISGPLRVEPLYASASVGTVCARSRCAAARPFIGELRVRALHRASPELRGDGRIPALVQLQVSSISGQRPVHQLRSGGHESKMENKMQIYQHITDIHTNIFPTLSINYIHTCFHHRDPSIIVTERHHRTRPDLTNEPWRHPHGPSHRAAFDRITRGIDSQLVELGFAGCRRDAPRPLSTYGGGAERKPRRSPL